MPLNVEHDLHGRRKGRNVGVGLMLGAFVVLVMVLTFVKITQTDFATGPGAVGPASGTAPVEGN
ncbi:cytochrome C oxidase assembly protein [Sulfitobacter sp. M57]|uniref:cytochrome C oxidase assembly protein n=1 Tax=unclassified Sulfitobacter TaxID=196795 RepID=UPI0023E1BF75|nr:MULTISPECIES: cytochrome C oxidase assembly protein [unclassified Sulfitobacter]MDF3412988.1 cytochrome C oxidase assembly protein [Sulfitobacter sp. KE5]MDF3421728.1 cytochrome C oxidase assembly protein [Sulfitobacter sp. KE43]MDF3431537.1 cytochrome C oxidase assembly protein [Sulfitobacter sp. KE42]MDF3457178.1 cytochrome C oxidase assembly protein [Sulfitobacter sp. S74]MDF3461081.1 cytochrome C oxidase assembly protein [Sulfitobacter sp. Ks18]